MRKVIKSWTYHKEAGAVLRRVYVTGTLNPMGCRICEAMFNGKTLHCAKKRGQSCRYGIYNAGSARLRSRNCDGRKLHATHQPAAGWKLTPQRTLEKRVPTSAALRERAENARISLCAAIQCSLFFTIRQLAAGVWYRFNTTQIPDMSLFSLKTIIDYPYYFLQHSPLLQVSCVFSSRDSNQTKSNQNTTPQTIPTRKTPAPPPDY